VCATDAWQGGDLRTLSVCVYVCVCV